jgi:hypothetical protein
MYLLNDQQFVGQDELPYPAYVSNLPYAMPMADMSSPVMASMNPMLGQAPGLFTVSSPIIPSDMLTPTVGLQCPENIAPPLTRQFQMGDASTAYLATGATMPPAERGDVRNVLEPLLLADLLFGGF